MNTVFQSFPYQYKSMLNKYFFCIKKLLFLIPNQNYLGKHRLLTNLGHSIGLSVTSANPPLPLQTLLLYEPSLAPPLPPSPLRALSPVALSSSTLSYCSRDEELPIDRCVQLCSFSPCPRCFYDSRK